MAAELADDMFISHILRSAAFIAAFEPLESSLSSHLQVVSRLPSTTQQIAWLKTGGSLRLAQLLGRVSETQALGLGQKPQNESSSSIVV